MFGTMRLYAPPEFAPLNLWTNPGGAIAAAEVPGVRPDDLEISIRRDAVTLLGSRKEKVEDAAILRQERMTGSFIGSASHGLDNPPLEEDD
jgi:HSP20 family protein